MSQVQSRGATEIFPQAEVMLRRYSERAFERISTLTPGLCWQLRELHQCALLSTAARLWLSPSSQWIDVPELFVSCPFICLQPWCVRPNWSSGSSPLWPVGSGLCTQYTFIFLLLGVVLCSFSFLMLKRGLDSLDGLHAISAALSVSVLEKQLLISIKFWLLISTYLSGSSSPLPGPTSYSSLQLVHLVSMRTV